MGFNQRMGNVFVFSFFIQYICYHVIGVLLYGSVIFKTRFELCVLYIFIMNISKTIRRKEKKNQQKWMNRDEHLNCIVDRRSSN